MQRSAKFLRLAFASCLLVSACDTTQSLDPSVSDAEISAARMASGSEVATPSNQLATAIADTQINFSWQDNSTNETRFEIYRSTPGILFTPTILIASPEANATLFSDTGITVGVEYCYQVRAQRVNGKKIVSSGMTERACAVTPAIPPPVTPDAPSNARIGAFGSQYITVNWDDNANAESGFEVHRSTTGPNGVFTHRSDVVSDIRGYHESGLTAFSEYCYMVRAFTFAGTSRVVSSFSNVVCAQTVPSPASGATAVPGSSNTVIVSWSAVGWEFRIERSLDNGLSWTTASGRMIDLRSYEAAAPAEQTVCYRVINHYETYDTAPSNTACTVAPAAPSGVRSTSTGPGTTSLTWIDNSSVEDGYEVRGWMDECYPNGDGGTDCYGYAEFVVAVLPANSTSYSGPGENLSVYARKSGGYSSVGTP